MLSKQMKLISSHYNDIKASNGLPKFREKWVFKMHLRVDLILCLKKRDLKSEINPIEKCG
jgi:hypothetical protein